MPEPKLALFFVCDYLWCIMRVFVSFDVTRCAGLHAVGPYIRLLRQLSEGWLFLIVKHDDQMLMIEGGGRVADNPSYTSEK